MRHQGAVVESRSMSKPWLRGDTQEWIAQMENRVADMQYYLEEALLWLASQGYCRPEITIACLTMTCVWVSNMRNEKITAHEIMEIIGASTEDAQTPNSIFELAPQFKEWNIEEIWYHVIRQYDDPDYHPQKPD